MFGFKVCSADAGIMLPCLVVLDISPSAIKVPTEWDPTGTPLSYRCDWAGVRAIWRFEVADATGRIRLTKAVPTAFSCFYKPEGKAFIYQAGKKVWVRDFDMREYITESTGIHFYTNQYDAYNLSGYANGM